MNATLKSSLKPTEINSYSQIRTCANRSVYGIGAPHRENFLAKDDRLIVGGAACPGSRRGPPSGVTVFANARIYKTTL